jgi:hypothetical protein
MLREWIQNISTFMLNQIVSDRGHIGSYIWNLAQEELVRRYQLAA